MGGVAGALAGRHGRKVKSGRLRGVRLIFEGLTSRPGVRCGSPSRSGRGRPEPAAHSRSRKPSATVLGLPVARARPGNVPGAVVGVVSVKGGSLPAERGELARAGDRDDAGGLAPLVRAGAPSAGAGDAWGAVRGSGQTQAPPRRVGVTLRGGPPGRAAGSRFRPAAAPSGPSPAPFHMPSDSAEQAGRWMRCSRRTLLGSGGDD
jgi:hypothetical protein